MSGAYYNENNPKAAAWLRELIRENLIAPGEVDERSIKDVQPSDVRGFTQLHWFAGIGGWSYALRLAGWPDDRKVITGSCPCPPFSSAGKKKRCPTCRGKPIPHPRKTGIFACVGCAHEWIADDRHLWPEMLRIIAHLPQQFCNAPIFGEQVAGADGLIWLAGVRATLEELGRSVGAVDMCVAGKGAPHIRQRLWWMAIAEGEQSHRVRDAGGWRRQPANGGRLGESFRSRLEGLTRNGDDVDKSRWDGAGKARSITTPGWSSFDLIHCRDGKSRRIESGTFPLVDGISKGMVRSRDPSVPINADATSEARVMRLAGYGNAINPVVAAEFIRAYMTLPE